MHTAFILVYLVLNALNEREGQRANEPDTEENLEHVLAKIASETARFEI